MEIKIREYDPHNDSAYIYSTWTRYSYYSPVEPITLSKREFFQLKTAEIKAALQHAQVKIACLKETPFVILGYIVMYQQKLLWKCVKKDFHHMGIDEILLKSVQEK